MLLLYDIRLLVSFYNSDTWIRNVFSEREYAIQSVWNTLRFNISKCDKKLEHVLQYALFNTLYNIHIHAHRHVLHLYYWLISRKNYLKLTVLYILSYRYKVSSRSCIIKIIQFLKSIQTRFAQNNSNKNRVFAEFNANLTTI